MEITKNNMNSTNKHDRINQLVKMKKKLKRQLKNKSNIIERYKSALQLRNVPTLNLFSNLLYDIKE